MFHRVSRIDPTGIQANEGLKASPEYLERFVRQLRRESYKLVSLDHLANAVLAGDSTTGLAALTFDDGYKDNLELALPILERLEVPFTVFVTVALASGDAFLWWFALEAFLKGTSHCSFLGRQAQSHSRGK